MTIKNRINTCFIHLQDLKKAKEWYTTVFPFEIEAEADGDFLLFKMEGTELMLLQSHHQSITPLPYSVFFFETDNVEETYRELTGKGIRADEIEPFPEGMRGFHVYDPEGNMLLICSRPAA
ncbi:VOC family protein [Paenibacillus nanensis]|uniref:VOC family protein n=1 Tax=Paenibacillus nanensis TaxID=393251 RepID=A0A3A1USB5_9BACL|nr:glyoxalase superfamily protein [Paenibacillus nanensis]RIX51439.1 VOC family protein [Paenibacillus nanensis]